MVSDLKQRRTAMPVPVPDIGGGTREIALDNHPAGAIRHGGPKQALRFFLFVTYFWSCCCTIVAQQLLGSPLYFIKRDWYYKNIALTKESFGLTITLMTQWWSPTVVRISGDKSVSGQIRQLPDGRVELDFPERLVLIANHQKLYSDWLYLWWVGYTNKPKMHGHFYIILKESLKYIPIMGQGMQFYNFIFMSRKWAKDKARMAYRLNKLKQKVSGRLTGEEALRPMWLLIFPEGTNLSQNTKANSSKWAAKQGIEDLQHQVLPRTTGTFFCLNELKGTVDFVYDCTLAYEGIPRGKYGQDYFTLRSTYFEGRPPKSVNMYWRRFALADMPLDDSDKFQAWMLERWREKDALLEEYVSTGRFPASEDLEIFTKDSIGSIVKTQKNGFVETEVKPAHWWEILQIFMVLASFALASHVLSRTWHFARNGTMAGYA